MIKKDEKSLVQKEENEKKKENFDCIIDVKKKK